MHWTPIDGTTLLHLAIDFDEEEIFELLLANGADVNAPASVDGEGFGGHTPIFNAVVSHGKRQGSMARSLVELRCVDDGARIAAEVPRLVRDAPVACSARRNTGRVGQDFPGEELGECGSDAGGGESPMSGGDSTSAKSPRRWSGTVLREVPELLVGGKVLSSRLNRMLPVRIFDP